MPEEKIDPEKHYCWLAVLPINADVLPDGEGAEVDVAPALTIHKAQYAYARAFGLGLAALQQREVGMYPIECSECAAMVRRPTMEVYVVTPEEAAAEGMES